MNRIKHLTTISIVLLAFSCGSKKTENKVETKTFLTGRYVNNTVLSQMADTIPAGIPSYCLELNFTEADSVDIFFGFEEGKLSYKKEGDQFIILKASNQGNMSFIVNADNTITLVDSAWTEVNTNSTFKKVDDVEGEKWAFEKYMNEAMVVGEYTLYAGTQAAKEKVVFTADGKVTGFFDFKTYSICYAGDCVAETIPMSNTISFEKTDGTYADYAFRIDKKNKTIQLFNIEPAKQDIKGERKILNSFYELRK